MSNSVWPHRWLPTRLPRPWDPSGKNTGVACHFLLQCMQAKSESEVAQLCPTSWPFLTSWAASHQTSLSFTISQSLPKFMLIASVMPSRHLLLWCPLLLPLIFPSVRGFSNESSVCIRWPKYWSFSFCISPSHEYSALLSLKIDWFDLLAVQGTFRSLLQHHSSEASILCHSAIFTVQLSQPYVTTGKTIAFLPMGRSKTIGTFVGRVMPLLFNTLSRFVIIFLLRSNHLLISWLQSLSAVILEPKKWKFSHCFHLFPFYLPCSNGARCHEFSSLIFSVKLLLSLSSFIHIKRFFSSSCYLSIHWYHLHIWRCWCFSHLSWFQLVTHPARHFSWCAQCRD